MATAAGDRQRRHGRELDEQPAVDRGWPLRGREHRSPHGPGPLDLSKSPRSPRCRASVEETGAQLPAMAGDVRGRFGKMNQAPVRRNEQSNGGSCIWSWDMRPILSPEGASRCVRRRPASFTPGSQTSSPSWGSRRRRRPSASACTSRMLYSWRRAPSIEVGQHVAGGLPLRTGLVVRGDPVGTAAPALNLARHEPHHAVGRDRDPRGC